MTGSVTVCVDEKDGAVVVEVDGVVECGDRGRKGSFKVDWDCSVGQIWMEGVNMGNVVLANVEGRVGIRRRVTSMIPVLVYQRSAIGISLLLRLPGAGFPRRVKA